MPFSRRTLLLGATSLTVLFAAGCTKPSQQPADASDQAAALLAAGETPKTPEKLAWLADQAATADGVQTGFAQSSKVAYTFFDPRCPHCTRLYQASRPLAKQVSLIWIPVAFLGPQSAELTAGILSSANRSSVLDDMEMRRVIPPAESTEKLAKAQQTAYANTQVLLTMMQGEKSASVPYTVFKDSDGHIYDRAGEMTTEDLKSFLRL